uniref:Uncharacterized protein n=1 Tax=Rhizophora mucronata TaxID=61149 RepID=A0A2P2PCT7_RHIMU
MHFVFSLSMSAMEISIHQYCKTVIINGQFIFISCDFKTGYVPIFMDFPWILHQVTLRKHTLLPNVSLIYKDGWIQWNTHETYLFAYKLSVLLLFI